MRLAFNSRSHHSPPRCTGAQHSPFLSHNACETKKMSYIISKFLSHCAVQSSSGSAGRHVIRINLELLTASYGQPCKWELMWIFKQLAIPKDILSLWIPVQSCLCWIMILFLIWDYQESTVSFYFTIIPPWVSDLIWSSRPWFLPGPIPITVAIWGVDQWMEISISPHSVTPPFEQTNKSTAAHTHSIKLNKHLNQL